MTGSRLLIHAIFLFLLPVVVAWLGISTLGAIGLVIVALLWRWAITLSGILAPAKVPNLELETITASHFVEKVRWCMDRLGVVYTERQMAGVLGVFFTGRTVPRLKIRTGAVRSTIGNSPEILRYLWGAYATELGDAAAFLEPTRERLELEQELDRYGVNLQVWVYYHILDDRELTQNAWGCNNPAIPAWQRYAVRVCYPVLAGFLRKAFSISDTQYAKAVKHIEALLAKIDGMFIAARVSILGGESIDYVDITFASLSALWLQPAEFGRGVAEVERFERERMPAAMRADVERWTENYPKATKFILRLYAQER